MQRIRNIWFFFIVTVLAVAMACQQTTDPAKEPSKDVEAAAAQAPVDPADDLPVSVRMLAPEYHEAYRLLPSGPWAREYIALRLEEVESIDWEKVKATYAGPYPTPAPELGLGEEFQLRQALTKAGDEEWLIRKVRSLDADAAKRFEATQDVTERLEALRRLVEVGGKEHEVLEIQMEWEMRMLGLSEAEIARQLEDYRAFVAMTEARDRWPIDELYARMAEVRVCDLVMNCVVGQLPRTAYTAEARCDIDKALSLAEAALETNGGQAAYSEENFREMVEFTRQNPGKWRDVPPSGDEG